MFELDTNRRILQIVDGTFDNALSGFITDRLSRQLSPRMIDYYVEKLSKFQSHIYSQGITYLYEINSEVVRLYLLQMLKTCNNGGVHAHFRALRSFFNWCEMEMEKFKNPIKNVAAPKINNQPIEGIALNDVMKMVKACTTGMALRDKAILLTLTDTGCRGSEFLALDVGDVDLIKDEIQILHGNGNKSRIAILGGTACDT